MTDINQSPILGPPTNKINKHLNTLANLLASSLLCRPTPLIRYAL